MLCSFRRSKDEGWFSTTYCLDIQIQISDEERKILGTSNIGEAVIFDSEAREEYQDAADEHFDASSKAQPSVFQPLTDIAWGTASVFYHVGAAFYNTALGSLALRITVQDILDGAHIESDDDGQLLLAEQLIARCVELLNERLQYLATFDGTEHHHEI